MRWESGRQSSNIEDRRGLSGGTMVGGGGIGMLLLVLVSHSSPVRTRSNCSSRWNDRAPGGQPACRPAACQRSSGANGVGRARRHRGHVAPDLLAERTPLRGPRARCCSARRAVGLRHRARRDRPVLLPGRSARSISTCRSSDELDERFGAPGDFAQAYVVAHEVGHHVQTLLGISNRVTSCGRAGPPSRGQRAVGAAGTAGRLLRRRLGAPRRTIATSWKQAMPKKACARPRRLATTDCRSRRQGYVSPESFTHGTSAQRQEWLMRGLKTRRHQSVRHLRRLQLTPASGRLPGRVVRSKIIRCNIAVEMASKVTVSRAPASDARSEGRS